MHPEQKNQPSDWARQERRRDLAWIGENASLFFTAAQEAFAAGGRGALIVDTTFRSKEGGHPFAYFPQALVEEIEDDDMLRMVREYDPGEEFVIALLKAEGRVSTYRVRPLPPPAYPGPALPFSLS